jgi:hypothetical protein
MKDVIGPHRGDLEDLAETDLPAAEIAETLLEAAETED